uniref:Monocarboxylate transporter 12-like n=1 Tax=Saccoglossus kowalevskii TaxID=10224 RepID=A0ABM0GNH9_SACKO|nr:PREDICTED: monocarboxylate transporter 12-like [Saccoglossus kowalevskii]
MNEKKPCSVEEPPDGGYGWVILVSSMAIAFICGGNFYNCGIFLVSFVEHFQQGTAQVSLIGSISSALYVSSGLLANPLCKRFGVRIVVMVAGSISTVGVILSIFTPSLMFLYFSYGVLVGFGRGVSVFSTFLIMPQYFKKRYAVANGMTFVGVSVGILCLAPLYNFVIEVYGWRGAMFIVAGIDVHLLVFGSLLRPLPRESNGEKNTFYKLTAGNSERDDVSKNELKYHHSLESMAMLREQEYSPVKTKHIRTGHFFIKCSNLPVLKLFLKNPVFSLIYFAQLLESFGISTTLMYIVARAISMDISRLNASFLMTLMGIGWMMGCLSHGWIVHTGYISAITLMGLTIAGSGMAVLCIVFVHTYALLVVFVVCYGIFCGTYQPVIMVALRECVEDKDHGTAAALDWSIMSVGYMFGPPIAGWLYDTSGTFNTPFLVAGGVLVCSGIMVLLASRMKTRLEYGPFSPRDYEVQIWRNP